MAESLNSSVEAHFVGHVYVAVVMALAFVSVTDAESDSVQSAYWGSWAEGVIVNVLSFMLSESVAADIVMVCAVAVPSISHESVILSVETVLVFIALLKVRVRVFVTNPESLVVLSAETALMVLPAASLRLETVGAVESELELFELVELLPPQLKPLPDFESCEKMASMATMPNNVKSNLFFIRFLFMWFISKRILLS